MREARASPSTSSAMMSSGLPCLATASRKGEDANGAQQSTGYYSEGSDELSSGTLAKGGTVSGNVYFKGDLARVLYFGNLLEKTATASWSLS